MLRYAHACDQKFTQILCSNFFVCHVFLDQVPAKARESTPPPAIPERPDLESVTIRPGIAAELLELLRMK